MLVRQDSRARLWRAVLWLCGSVLALGLAQAAWAQSHPFGVPESGGAGPGWMSGVFGQIAAWQSHFYRQLTGAVRAWQADGTAAWLLLGLSFAYGVFHALGPGHGKAVIAAYVVANRQTARNGAILALVSALLQALVAIVMVAVLGWVLSVTAAGMNRATAWLEMVSYGLIVALGLWLVWRKAVRPLLPARAASHAHGAHGGDVHHAGHDHEHAHAHEHGHRHGHADQPMPVQPHGHAHAHAHEHAHSHHDDCGCGHAHVAPADAVSGKLDLRRATAAIAAVGLRPCSGALIVLVFALAQGFFIAGVAAALAMGVGTGLTVAVLTMLAAWARAGAVRLGARLSSPAAARLRYLIDALAAVFVLAVGILLLGGQLALN
ncbi:nickel transporter [Bordetella genomosp. 5]|uniref:nickel/cobalt transporter n=1 Tax=Bordetella genomosp. 5 TaxID=1395608 RepID=UPI000B9E44AC|nr:nickel/cobalt transporter [Bordetella genomosp. 5]OZI33512.1 nickel transporter [Bordetella genomosp. 5]